MSAEQYTELTNHRKRILLSQRPTVWNSLPDDLWYLAADHKHFRRELTTFIHWKLQSISGALGGILRNRAMYTHLLTYSRSLLLYLNTILHKIKVHLRITKL